MFRFLQVEGTLDYLYIIRKEPLYHILLFMLEKQKIQPKYDAFRCAGTLLLGVTDIHLKGIAAWLLIPKSVLFVVNVLVHFAILQYD